MMDDEEVKPFELNVDSSEIEDLRVRPVSYTHLTLPTKA